jgi:transcriptional regulator with XRE-family HTH domain
MKLATYLETHEIKVSDLASRLGVPVSTVSRWARGERIPRIEMAERLREATGGAVTFADFLSAPTEGAAA